MRQLSQRRYKQIQVKALAATVAWETYCRLDDELADLLYADTIDSRNWMHALTSREWTLDELLAEMNLLKPTVTPPEETADAGE